MKRNNRIDEYDRIYNSDDAGINRLRGTIKSGDCLFCSEKNAMRFKGNCFVCSKCGNSVDDETYYRWTAGYPIEIVDDLGRAFCDPSYEDIYDDDGDITLVECGHCLGGHIRWKEGKYICPECGEEMSRAEFFNAIGVEPLGPKCLTCKELYPGCTICLHGYLEEEDI